MVGHDHDFDQAAGYPAPEFLENEDNCICLFLPNTPFYLALAVLPLEFSAKESHWPQLL